jgi:hypothetical protein
MFSVWMNLPGGDWQNDPSTLLDAVREVWGFIHWTLLGRFG